MAVNLLPRAARKAGIVIIMLLAAAAAAADHSGGFSFTVNSTGGTPFLLEFHLEDPDETVQEVRFDFSANGVTDYLFLVTDDHREEEKILVYRGIPHRGFTSVHRMTVELVTTEHSYFRTYETAFADFQWGRDNLRFANDNRFRDTAGPVSDYLLDWAAARFGPLTEEQEMLLISLMYRLFRGNIGRCYGFSASGLYYHAHPWVIDGDYPYAYALDEQDPQVIELIHMVQNDIVYEIFSSDGISPELDHGPEDLSVQRGEIISSIRSGRPVILGYLSRNTHHSMTAFGYIKEVDTGRLLVTAANNWNRDQSDTLNSKDAVIIPIYEKDGTYQVDWLTYTYRSEDRLFVIDPAGRTVYSRETFDFLLEQEKQQILSEKKVRIIAEHPLWAYLEDDAGIKRGFDGMRSWWSIPGVSYRRFDDIFIFDIPRNRELTLHIGGGSWNDRREEFKAPSLYIAAPHGDEFEVTVLRNLDIGEEESMSFTLTVPEEVME